MAAVLGGILVIAVADAMSDALGIHLAEESDPDSDHQQVWAATLWTFVTKFVFALSFAVPLLLLPLTSAVAASVVWGMFVIVVLSILLARTHGDPVWQTVLEHLGIAMLVVVLSHLIGRWVGSTFG